MDSRTTRHPGFAISQRIRKRVEEAFGWATICPAKAVSGPLSAGGFEEGEFEDDSPTEEVAAQVGVFEADPV